MKPIDVKSSTYIDFVFENNDKHPKYKFGDYVRISKYKKIFSKDYAANCLEKVFVIIKVRNNVPWTYVTNDNLININNLVFKKIKADEKSHLDILIYYPRYEASYAVKPLHNVFIK